ncbi:MAG: hypothetical protein AAGJ87_17410, partial [Pseudomonadota bacterium]
DKDHTGALQVDGVNVATTDYADQVEAEAATYTDQAEADANAYTDAGVSSSVASPKGVVTPSRAGQLHLDTQRKQLWAAPNINAGDWFTGAVREYHLLGFLPDSPTEDQVRVALQTAIDQAYDDDGGTVTLDGRHFIVPPDSTSDIIELPEGVSLDGGVGRVGNFWATGVTNFSGGGLMLPEDSGMGDRQAMINAVVRRGPQEVDSRSMSALKNLFLWGNRGDDKVFEKTTPGAVGAPTANYYNHNGFGEAVRLTGARYFTMDDVTIAEFAQRAIASASGPTISGSAGANNLKIRWSQMISCGVLGQGRSIKDFADISSDISARSLLTTVDLQATGDSFIAFCQIGNNAGHDAAQGDAVAR